MFRKRPRNLEAHFLIKGLSRADSVNIIGRLLIHLLNYNTAESERNIFKKLISNNINNRYR